MISSLDKATPPESVSRRSLMSTSPSSFHGKNRPPPDRNAQQGQDGVEKGDSIVVGDRSGDTSWPKVMGLRGGEDGLSTNNGVEAENDLKCEVGLRD